MIPTLTFIYDRKKVASRTKKGVVELRITADGRRKYISTSIKLLPKEWSNGSVAGCKQGWKELNEQLHLLYKRVAEIVTKQMEEGRIDLGAIPNLLKSSMLQNKTFLDYCKEIADRRMQEVSKGTRKRYKVFLNYLEEWKGIVYFSDVTERNILKMDANLKKRGLKDGSKWNYHKFMKIFIHEAMIDNILKYDPYDRLHIKRGNEACIDRYLTSEEFERLRNVRITSLPVSKVRDLFIFQTYTMMSISDLLAFDYSLCKTINKQLVYQSNRIKTNQPFVCIINDEAKEILQKYNYVLPTMSDQKYNMYLKSLAALANIDKPLSSHWARHTGATLLRNMGVDLNVISKMMGHSKTDITARVYAKLHTETIADVISKLP